MSSSAVSAFIRGVVAGVISACIRGSLLFETCTRRTVRRLELMSVPDLSDSGAADGPVVGYAHLALAVGSRDAVDALTARLRADGARVRSAPRVTGDGYYEAV